MQVFFHSVSVHKVDIFLSSVYMQGVCLYVLAL